MQQKVRINSPFTKAVMPSFITHKTLEKCLKGQLCSRLMRQGAESKAIFVLIHEKVLHSYLALVYVAQLFLTNHAQTYSSNKAQQMIVLAPIKNKCVLACHSL